MPVFRVEKTKNYTVMSNYHFKEKEMSLKAKGLLSLMLALPDDWDFSISGLVSICKEGHDAVKSALDELKKFGYLEIKRVSNDGNGQSAWGYFVYEKPKDPNDGNPNDGNPNDGNPNDGNPNDGKHPYILNTKELNTKELSTDKLNTNNNIASGKPAAVSPKGTHFDYQLFIDYWNNNVSGFTSLPKIGSAKTWSETRKRNLRARAKQSGEKGLLEAFDRVAASDFLSGRNGAWLRCNFDWVIKAGNYQKIIEGNYDNREERNQHETFYDKVIKGEIQI